MPAKVKICGLTERASVAAALAAGADACGFVFFPPSPRNITPEQVEGLAGQTGSMLRVGLFVNADDALIGAAVSAGKLQALQLQGQESPERIADLKARFGLPVWRGVGVKSARDIAEATRTFGGADLLLLDAKPPEGATLPGGNGIRFDWRILAEAKPAMPWALAGGLSPDTVGDAIRLTGAPFVDVSSGVESAPGVKDVAKIAAFVESARRV